MGKMIEKNVHYYMSLYYPVSLKRIDAEDGGGWMAYMPLLKGCIADGNTKEEALNNIIEAKEAWIEFCLKKGLNIPEPVISNS